MISGSQAAVKAGKRTLRCGSNAWLRFQSSSLEALLPIFLCPAIESRPPTSATRSTSVPSLFSRPHASSREVPFNLSSRRNHEVKGESSSSTFAFYRSYSSLAASATIPDDAHANDFAVPLVGQGQLCHRNQHAERQTEGVNRRDDDHSARSSAVLSDWRRKFPSTRWRREIDFNSYSRPLRHRNLPDDAPALYEDEIKTSLAWLPDSTWTLSVPDDYPLKHELLLILDSLDDIAQSGSDPDCVDLLTETLRQAKEMIWSKCQNSLRRSQDRDVALYVAGRVAETYVKLDAEDSMDRLMAFLDYVRSQIDPLPLACFHALAARAGIARRYDAVRKICQVAQQHHGGKADAEILHLGLRALIAQCKDVDLTRYCDLFAAAGVAVPRKTFDLLLRTHVRRQDVGQVNQVLEAMPQHGYEIDARAWLTILRGFQSFRPTLTVMLRRDAKIVHRPTLNVVNRLLLLLSNELDVEGALMVLRIFRIPSITQHGDVEESPSPVGERSIINGPSLEPSAQTYAILTRMFGRLGRGLEALGFFRRAIGVCSSDSIDVASSEKALQRACSYVMQAYLNEGHPVRAMAFAAEVLELPYFGSASDKSAPSIDFEIPKSGLVKIATTNMHYRILLECASTIGSADSARRILVHLLAQGHPIDEHVLRGLARLIFSTIDKDALAAIRLIRSLLPRGANSVDKQRKQLLESLSDLLQHLGASERTVLASQRKTDLGRATNHVGSKSQRAMSSGYRPRLGKQNPSSKDDLREWLINDSSSLFRGLEPAPEADADVPALTHDLSRPLSPDAYALRIRVYAVVRRDYQSAQKVYRSMLTHQVKPTMMHIAPLIEGLTAVGKLQEAQQLKHNAKEVTGLQPTLRIHTALIRAYVRAGDSAAARKEIEELTGNGYKIDDTIANIIEAAQSGRRNFSLVDRALNSKDSHSVTTRFHALMRMRRYLAAQELLQTSLDSGMRPDRVLHDLVRRSVSYVQKEHAKALGSAGVASASHNASNASGSPVARPRRTSLPMGKSETGEDEMRLHIFELSQAARLAMVNRERITKAMTKHSEIRRKQMKEHRKKVVSLILDFADGRLHQQADGATTSTAISGLSH